MIAKLWNTGTSHLGSPRRFAIWPALAVGVGILTWMLLGNEPGKAVAVQTATATRGELTVTVGGVGRIVEAGEPVQSGGTSAAAVAAPGSTGAASSVPADGVVPRTSGRVSKLLVVPGQHVVAGQPVALLDDGGTTAAAVAQAQDDHRMAQVELQQTQATHLAGMSSAEVNLARAKADLETLRGGTPAARRRAIALARKTVALDRQRLSRLLAPPILSRADVSAADSDVKKAEADVTKAEGDAAKAEAEVKKAEADLAALLKPPTAPLPEAVAAAQSAVAAAKQKLAKLNAPADPATVAAADSVYKQAQANLSIVLHQSPPPTPSEVAAANAAVEAARLALAKVQAPADPADVSAAQLELDRATAELAALTHQPAAPSSQAVVAARQAVVAARQAVVAARQAVPAAQHTVQAARAKRAGLRAARKPNPADVTAAKVELVRAKADLQTLRAGPGHMALAALKRAITSSETMLGQFRPQQSSDLALGQLKIEAARSRLDRARQAQQLLTVRSPWAGTVTAVLAAPGMPADLTTTLVTVGDLTNLAAQVDLSEFDVARVKPGMKAVVRVDALGGKPFPGKVQYAALTGNNNSGVVTYPVRVSLGRAAGLRPGMNVSVRIIVAERHKVLKVPLEAVSHDADDHPIVNLLDASGETIARKVTLGLANNDAVEIAKGLKAGERVVLPDSQGAGGEE